MSWITIVPITFFLLILLNSIAVVFWARPKLNKIVKPKPALFWKGKITMTGGFIFGFFIIGVLVGMIAQDIYPTSQLGQLIEKHGSVIYFAWCLMITMILLIAHGIVSYRVDKDDAI